MNQQKKHKPKKQLNPYIRFTSVAFQMGATITLCVLLGKSLDRYFENENLIFTAMFSLLGVIGSIYKIIKSTGNDGP